jgi:hypothetical protein
MRILPLVFVLFIGFGVYAQSEEQATQSTAQITFEESVFEFGDITQGDRVQHVFNYTNKGTEPLILSSVKTTCGCTAPDWSREPLAPGESTSMTVSFNSTGKMGMQNKTITVNSNATNDPERIRITANVLAKPVPETAAPEANDPN